MAISRTGCRYRVPAISNEVRFSDRRLLSAVLLFRARAADKLHRV